jgi:4-amino-4-deoxy-L-arabinose transferase-like glycosyltransferase
VQEPLLADSADANEKVEPREPGAPKTERWALALVVALFCVWAFTYLTHQPWGGGLDEPQHRNYLSVLAEEHRLPWLQREGGRWVRYRDAHAMHPPGYYLAVLPLYAVVQRLPEQTIRFVLRVASLVLGAMTLLLAYPVARRALGADRHATLAATLLVALAPLYLLVSAIVNNDIASVLVYCALLYLGLVRWHDDLAWRRVLALGLLAGLAGLTKGTSEVAALGSGAYLVYTGCRGLGRRQAVLRTSAFAALAIALVAPWHLRNERLYGTLSYMPDDGKPTYLPVDAGPLVCLMHDNFPRVLRHVVQWQFNTLWSQKDWIPERDRSLVYGVLWLLFGVGLASVAGGCIGKRCDAPIRRAWGAFLCGALPLSAMAIVIACLFHQGWAEGGRYLLCLLLPVACAIAYPIRLVPERLVALRWGLVGLVAAAGIGLNVVCYGYLVHVLIPLYHPVP